MIFSHLFSDHAVLQREKSVLLKGNCRPFQMVNCAFAGLSFHCFSDSRGDFSVTLPPLPAGGPYEISACTMDGQETCRIVDVMVGEVWVASGQSNMAYSFGNPPNMEVKGWMATNEATCAPDYQAFLDANREPERIRFFTAQRNASSRREPDVYGEWQVADELGSFNMSAVGGWFALNLARRLPGIAIGIIDSSWGGTVTEAWTSEATLRQNPDEKEFMAEWDRSRADSKVWENIDPVSISVKKTTGKAGKSPVPEEGHEVLDPGISDFAVEWALPEYDDSDWTSFRIPGSWIERGVCGNGAVWLRMEIMLPEKLAEDEWMLQLGPVDKTDITYCNGHEVGRTGSGLDVRFWNMIRRYPVPSEYLRPGRNVIAVRGFSHSYDGGFIGYFGGYRLVSAKNGKFAAVSSRVKVELDFGRLKCPHGVGGLPIGPCNPNTPAILFDSMIRPLVGYGFRGAIWYQGESNASYDFVNDVYGRKIKDLIVDWRRILENGDFPFVQVLLPFYREYEPFDGNSSWAMVRKGQQDVTHLLPEVGCVPTLDQGESGDIHPARKELIGERLANWALRNVYGMKDVVCDGPVCLSAVREGGNIRLHFDSRIHQAGEYGTLGICVGKFPEDMALADARLDGECDVLVPAPGDVRDVCYAWSDHPAVSIFNDESLPAMPFLKSVD